MARRWEEAPLIYTQLDIKSLFCGDDLKKNGIQEVDMDTEDGDFGNPSNLQEGKPEKTIVPPIEDAPHVPAKDSKRWDAEEDHPSRLKELGKSKWSDDLDEADTQGSESMRTNNALSGLVQAYQKQRKSVHWSDQVGDTGFSIVAAKKANMLSLVIGPGAGYNLKSNPLSEEERPTSTAGVGKSKQSIFQERLRVEHESFKAVFDRRKQRIGGLDSEE